MQPSVTMWIILVPAISTLLAALVSQLISAISMRKTKRLELSFASKAEAYREFVIKAGTFAHDPKKEDHYRDYLQAFLSLRIVASDKVINSLLAPNGAHSIAQHLRVAAYGDYLTQSEIQGTTWNAAMEDLMLKMRDDLHSISNFK